MKRLYYVPFAFDSNSCTGMNIGGSRSEILEKYFKNICVSLFSARKNNKDCDIALVTNISEDDISKEYRCIFKKNNIKVITVPFDCFVFEENYQWSLAFYKLCALSHIVKMDYDMICYSDSDVFVQGSMQNIWEECFDNILLYDINHGLQVEDYRRFCAECANYFGERKYITHYGGEFFAANSLNAKKLVEVMKTVFENMKNKSISTSCGDEYILSISANLTDVKIKNAGAYIYRFWTSKEF